MAEQSGAEFRTTPLTAEEQKKAAIQAMAQRILAVAEEVRREHRFSEEPEDSTKFMWGFRGENSLSAEILREAVGGNTSRAERGMPVMFKGVAEHRWGSKGDDFLTREFLHRLGFIEKDEDLRPKGSFGPDYYLAKKQHPVLPLIAEAIVGGGEAGKPLFEGFVVRYQLPAQPQSTA